MHSDTDVVLVLFAGVEEGCRPGVCLGKFLWSICVWTFDLPGGLSILLSKTVLRPLRRWGPSLSFIDFIQLVTLSYKWRTGFLCWGGGGILSEREGEYELCVVGIGEDVDVCTDDVGQRDHECVEEGGPQ